MNGNSYGAARFYDRMIRWKGRLANEGPFFKRLFCENGVRKVLDCACGTGRHAVLFSEKGFDVTGSDIDPGMVAVARENARKAGAEVSFKVAGFRELEGTFGRAAFDAVICTGNSLSILPDREAVGEALRNMGAVLKPGGILLLHILNYSTLLKERERRMPVRHVSDAKGESLFVKVFRVLGGMVDVEIVCLNREGEAWSYDVRRGRLLPLEREPLAGLLEGAGFAVRNAYGDYAFNPYERDESMDLITVSERL